MTMQVWLTVEDDNIVAALRAFLGALLTSGQIDALLVPCRVGAGDAIVHTLIEEVAALSSCDPLAPAMPANGASLVSRLTVTDTGRQLGVVLRSCELRALIELTKLHQINMDHVTTIGVDCLGTYEVPDYAAMKRAGLDPDSIWNGAASGEPALVEDYQTRIACQMCEHPTADSADIRIGLIGFDYPRQALIESNKDLLLPLEMQKAESPERQKVVNGLKARRVVARDAALSAWRDKVSDIPSLLEQLSSCIRCHNCMVVCPICYCKECIFRTPTFDHDPEQYFRWADRKGALRMPADTLLFHLTRLNHMATSCIGCGMCDSACPSQLPVTTMFRAVAERVQALFDYEAGRSLDEELPLATFREDELHALGR